MKLLIPFFFFISVVILNAQSVILLEQDSVSALHENVDISDEFTDFALDLYFKNNTDEAISVNWRRELGAGCPEEWDIIVADENLTYLPFINESQLPINLSPEDTNTIIRQIFWPRSIAGCCDIKMIFSLDGEPDTPIDTGYYHIAINAGDCLVSAAVEAREESFNIYPNPVSSILNIENHHLIESIDIIDISGKFYHQMIAPISQKLDISSLPAGMFICKIKERSGKVLARKIIKQ